MGAPETGLCGGAVALPILTWSVVGGPKEIRAVVPWSLVWVGGAAAAGVVAFLAAVADDLQRQEHDLLALAARKEAEAARQSRMMMEGAELVIEDLEH